jgi:hypothetical protein
MAEVNSEPAFLSMTNSTLLDFGIKLPVAKSSEFTIVQVYSI